MLIQSQQQKIYELVSNLTGAVAQATADSVRGQDQKVIAASRLEAAKAQEALNNYLNTITWDAGND